MTTKNKLTAIDAVEKRPRWGASKQDAKHNEELRAKNNRIAELEAELGRVARGGDGMVELAIRLSTKQHEHLGLLTRSGLYGVSVEDTAAELVQIALREASHRDAAHNQFWSEEPFPLRRRKLRRPRRRPGKR